MASIVLCFPANVYNIHHVDEIGWRDCMVVIGVLQVSVIGCGALLRPIVLKPRQAAGDSSSSVDTSFQPLSASRTNLNNAQQEAPSQASPDKKCLTEEEKEQQACLKKQEDNEGQETVIVESSGPTTAISPASTKLLDFMVLCDGSFICYSLFGLFATLGTSLRFYITLLYYSQDMGMAALILGPLYFTICLSEIVGRLSGGCLVDCVPFRKINVLLLCMVLLTVVSVFVLCAGMYLWALSGFIFLSYLLGVVCSMHIPMLAEVDRLGIKRMPSAVGIYACIQSFGVLAVPLLWGEEDTKILPFACVGMGLGALFLGLVHPVSLCQGKRKE